MAISINDSIILAKWSKTSSGDFKEFREYYLKWLSETIPDTIYYKPDFGDEVQIKPINHWPDLKTYEVWMEGYAATGEQGPAQLLGKVNARNFAQACHILTCEAYLKSAYAANGPLHEGFWDGRWLYDAAALSVWGCRLFWSEELARRSFG